MYNFNYHQIDEQDKVKEVVIKYFPKQSGRQYKDGREGTWLKFVSMLKIFL